MGSASRPPAIHPEALGLVSQMRPALVRYFKRKTCSEAEAEDLAQDVLARALAHISWQDPAQARGYIFRAAVNRWRDQRRRTRTRGLVVEWNEATAQEWGVEKPPECGLINQEELELIIRALRTLHPKTRSVVMLIRFEQMKIAAVAEKLGISLRAVHRHLAKAMEAFELLRNG